MSEWLGCSRAESDISVRTAGFVRHALKLYTYTYIMLIAVLISKSSVGTWNVRILGDKQIIAGPESSNSRKT